MAKKKSKKRRNQPHPSDHAGKQMKKRDIRQTDLRAAMNYGEKLKRTGIVFYFIGENDLPEDAREILDYLIGTTILIDPNNNKIITAYRNPEALDDIMFKPEYAIP